jgi:hypothetical protein
MENLLTIFLSRQKKTILLLVTIIRIIMKCLFIITITMILLLLLLLLKDCKNKPERFDLLLNYAVNESNSKFLINDLGLELKYSSRIMVGFCKTILEHGIRS